MALRIIALLQLVRRRSCRCQFLRWGWCGEEFGGIDGEAGGQRLRWADQKSWTRCDGGAAGRGGSYAATFLSRRGV
jgi:hypothetical protein